jgi:hypothetical protein
MSTPSNIIFVGGPGSGKSNYLFRTWIALERKKDRLISNGLPDELQYLHSGASVLLDGKFAPHTSKDTQPVCEIPIVHRQDPSSKSTLVVPDATGELWLDLYEKREWPTRWDRLVTSKCGFLIFVCVGSPHNIVPLDWITCERTYGSGIAPAPTGVPTQVMLVDWIQILRAISSAKLGSNYMPRLSVVISAWDRVPLDRQQEGPQQYLDTEFPLLAQFIRANAHGFDAKVFGLSVVGGDLELDPEFHKEYVKSDPSNLGYTVYQSQKGLERSRDVLTPIYWALGFEV